PSCSAVFRPCTSGCSSGSELTALVPVAHRLADERLEQLHVLARLGVPEDAERKAPVDCLHGLDRTVLCLGCDPQAVADSPEPLVMVRLHGSVVAEEPGEARSGLDGNVVIDARA